jgi:2-iminoacetate synthase
MLTNMEFAIPGFIKQFCTPNAMTTLMEYLVDYASVETRRRGQELIAKELAAIEEVPLKAEVTERLHQIEESGKRDLYS